MKTIKIKTKSTGKAVAKVAGLLFCTSLFGLTLAAPSKAQQSVLGNPLISNQPIFYMMYLSYGGNWKYTYWAYQRAWAWGMGQKSRSWASIPSSQLPTPTPPSDCPWLFCTELFGLTLAAPSAVQQNSPEGSPPPVSPVIPSSDDLYPDAPSSPEPLTILGSVMGASGLIWLKKRRSETDKLA